MFSAVHTPASLRRRLKSHFPQPRMEVRALHPTIRYLNVCMSMDGGAALDN